MHKGEPRIIDNVENDSFHFRHFNADKEVVEGVVNYATSEIEEIIKF